MRLMNFNEKQFIKEVLGPMASTAAGENFDDAVIIDLAELTGQPDAPFLVYSIDQPSLSATRIRTLMHFATMDAGSPASLATILSPWAVAAVVSP